MTEKYDVDYFIDKFSKIHWRKIGESFENHCALVHCGVTLKDHAYSFNEEATALDKILESIAKKEIEKQTYYNVWYINDDTCNRIIKGKTPKSRILNALRKIKNEQIQRQN